MRTGGDLQYLFFQPSIGSRGGSGKQTGLMFGVEFPDGSKASSGAMGPHVFMERRQEPESPVLVLNNGGGSGGEDEFSGTGTLWLWPLPPAGGLRLVAQWTGFGLEETSIMLDGGRLRDAASGTQRYWPGEGSNHG